MGWKDTIKPMPAAGGSWRDTIKDRYKLEDPKFNFQAERDFFDAINPLGLGSKAGTYISAGMEKGAQLMPQYFGEGAIPGEQNFDEAQKYFDAQRIKEGKEAEKRSPRPTMGGRIVGDSLVPTPGAGMAGLPGVATRVGSVAVMSGYIS